MFWELIVIAGILIALLNIFAKKYLVMDFFSKMGLLVINLAVIMPFLSYIINKKYPTSGLTLLERLGTTGDFLGGTTVGLLTLASIFYIISTLVAQKESLKKQDEALIAQKESLSKQNEELILSRAEFENLNIEMKNQQFENAFFTLLSLLSESIKNLHIYNEVEEKNYYGIQAVKHRLFLYEFWYHNGNFNRYVYCILHKLNEDDCYSKDKIINSIKQLNSYINNSKNINKNYFDTGNSFVFDKVSEEEQMGILNQIDVSYHRTSIYSKGIFPVQLLFHLSFFGEENISENLFLKYLNEIPLLDEPHAYLYVEKRSPFHFENIIKSLINILEFIDTHTVFEHSKSNNKEFYINIIKNHLNLDILTLLFYHRHIFSINQCIALDKYNLFEGSYIDDSFLYTEDDGNYKYMQIEVNKLHTLY